MSAYSTCWVIRTSSPKLKTWEDFLGVSEHGVATPSPHKLDCVSVKARHEECHCAASAHGVVENFFWGENDFWSCGLRCCV